MASIIKEAKYIKADYKNNNNKFWYIFLFDDFSVTTEYGRVGKNSQSTTKNFYSLYQAENFFYSKCREKETQGRNGEIAYRPLNIVSNQSKNGTVIIKENLASIAEKQIEHDQATIDLIRYLAKVNIHNIVSNTKITYDSDSCLFSTPCGIVTASTISDARNLLSKISSNIKSGNIHSENYGSLINDYLMMIPQDLGMRRFDPATLYKGQEDIQKQNNILDSLEASLNSVISSPVKNDKTQMNSEPQTVVFHTKLLKVADPNIIKAVTQKYNSTKSRMHTCYHLNVFDIYKVEIEGMKNNFESVKNKINNVKELFHGSSAANLLSIMKSGLVIPHPNANYCTGRLFGDGIYASETSTKAAGYSYGFWGGAKQDRFFVFILDMAMGKSYIPSTADMHFPVKGYDSTYVPPNTCKIGSYGQATYVKNNECIVYDVSQVNLKYLVELR